MVSSSSQAYDYRKVPGARPICDSSLQTDWYRVLSYAGDRKPDKCVPSYHCGTHAAGWLRGGHPTVQQGIVSRTVCYHWINNCCWRSNNILVRICGHYFVYKLQKPPGCQYRYCGVGYTREKLYPLWYYSNRSTTALINRPKIKISSDGKALHSIR